MKEVSSCPLAGQLFNTNYNVFSCMAKDFKPLAGNQWIGIYTSNNDTVNCGCGYRLSARGLFPMMCTWLKGYIHRCARKVCICSIPQGMNFCMYATITLVPALGKYLSIAHYNASNQGIGAHMPRAKLCELYGTQHVARVYFLLSGHVNVI
jgi:hypothetical protein